MNIDTTAPARDGTPYARAQTNALYAGYRAYTMQCIRAASRPLSFDDWFVGVIVETLAGA